MDSSSVSFKHKGFSINIFLLFSNPLITFLYTGLINGMDGEVLFVILLGLTTLILIPVCLENIPQSPEPGDGSFDGTDPYDGRRQDGKPDP